MGRFTENVKELTQSRLVRNIAAGFTFIVVVNTVFFLCLSNELMQTEEHAAREAKLFCAAQKVSNLAKTLLDHRKLLEKLGTTQTREAKDEHALSVRQLAAESKALVRTWKAADMPTAEVESLTSMVSKLTSFGEIYFSDSATGAERSAAFEAFLKFSAGLYTEAMDRMQRVHDLITSEQRPPSDIDPMTLCMVAVGINLIACLFAGYFMITRITGPITRLANTCRLLMEGRVIAAPASQNTEIGRLEETFHEMSSVVAETEDTRISFLMQMQNVQEVTLQNVKSSVEHLAMSHGGKKKSAQDSFNLMKTSLDGMLFLLSSMTYGLNFSADDELKLSPTLSSTTELLNDTSRTVTWLMRRKKIELVVEDPVLELECDIHLIQRVLVNLLSNASKYSSNGAQIKLSAVEFEGGVRFEVRDFGCGISIENQKKLFQKFSQVEAVDGLKRAGSGLGLLICKNIVEAHGGDIGCDSQENQGSCFWFELPFRVEKVNNTPVVIEEPEHSQYRGKFTRSLILLLALYVAAQSVLAFNLVGKFQYFKETGISYSKQKELTMGTQELLATFLTWRQKSLLAVRAGDVQSFMDLQPLLRKQAERVGHLASAAALGSSEQKHLSAIKASLVELISLADNAIDNIDLRKPDIYSAEFMRADAIAKDVETSVFAILSGKRNEMDSSYDLEQQLRMDIHGILFWTTIVNVVVMTLLCLIGLSIVSRITELNSKVIQFAFGGDLTRSLHGDDELAFLDERLCDVAQKVRSGQRQRQDLMAVINHDLRTPLGAFLNGLEMLSAGMFGEVSADEELLIEQAEADARSVLNIIDDFLASEKSEYENEAD